MSWLPDVDRQLAEIRALLVDDHGNSRLSRIERKTEMALAKLDLILQKEDKIMADQDSILAKVTANTNTLKSIAAGVTAASEGHATIMDEIAALKAANPKVDFTALDTATDEQTALLGGLAAAIPANTPAATGA